MASKLKLLKEEEKLLLSIEAKLSRHLQDLQKEEVYLQALLTQTEVEGKEKENTVKNNEVLMQDFAMLDNQAMNAAPLDDLNKATSSFYKMYQGGSEEEEEEEDDDENPKSNKIFTSEDVSQNLFNIIRQMQDEEL